jgi:hypothetical protein
MQKNDEEGKAKAEREAEEFVNRSQPDEKDIQIERYQKTIAELKAKEADQEKKNLLLEKSLWASQRASKESSAREKMLQMSSEAEETKMKSKIRGLETQISQYKENMEDMKNQHDDHAQELNDQIEQARTDTAKQLNEVYKR